MPLLSDHFDGATVAKRRNASGPLDVRVEIRMDVETHERVQVQADRLGISVGSYLRQATIRALERDEAEQARVHGDE